MAKHNEKGMPVDFNGFRRQLTGAYNDMLNELQDFQEYNTADFNEFPDLIKSVNKVGSMINSLNCMESEVENFDCMPDDVEAGEL